MLTIIINYGKLQASRNLSKTVCVFENKSKVVKNMGVGELIKHIRVLHGLNQTELGDLMYRNRDFVYMVENGRTSPTVKDLIELSKALNEPILLYVAYGITFNDMLDTKIEHS